MITIGIPTYNRGSIVIKNTANIIEFLKNNTEVRLLIIDNNSTDDSYSNIINGIGENNKIDVYQNKTNIGFHGNVKRLIEECKTEYLLLMSDEDEVILENLNTLIQFLKKKKPAFCSPQFIKNQGKGYFIYRGKEEQKLISKNDFHSSSFYISGLIYRVQDALKYLVEIENKRNNYIVCDIYFHTVVALHLLIDHKCYWYDKQIAKQIFSNEPNVKQGLVKYNVLDSRWVQFKSFLGYLELLATDANNEKQKEVINKIIQSHKDKCLLWLQWGLCLEMPELFINLKKGSKKIQNKYKNIKDADVSVATKSTWLLTK